MQCLIVFTLNFIHEVMISAIDWPKKKKKENQAFFFFYPRGKPNLTFFFYANFKGKDRKKNSKSKQKQMKQCIINVLWLSGIKICEETFSKVRDTYIEKNIAKSFDGDSVIDTFNNTKEHHNSRCITLVYSIN